MTATIARHRPGPGREDAGRDGFGRILRAEWIKFRTVRGWVIAVVIAVVLMDLVGLFAGGSVNTTCDSGGGRVQHGAVCVPQQPLGPGGVPVNDSFTFVRQPLTGNGSITVRVTSLTGRYGGGAGPASQGPVAGSKIGVQPWSKAGIIIKQSTRQGSAYAAMMVTGSHGVRMQYDFTHDIAGLAGPVSARSPRWLRLTRSADTITGYDSADGTRWAEVGAATLAGLSSTVQAGMFATSPAYMNVSQVFGGNTGQIGPSLATGSFDHVSLAGGRVKGAGEAGGATWTGVDVGNQDAFGSQSGQLEGIQRAGGRFTVTGSGDIAPQVPGIGGGDPNSTIEGHLIGVFAGLIFLVVIGAMFMTAEYRRGLIRTTLAATPRRGRVLAAKAIVIASVTFAAGLIAAVIAVAVGARLSHDQGTYVFPVSWLTWVRVVAGTAALLAVATVLALALGTMLRRSAAAVTAAIMVTVVPFILGIAQVLPVGAAEWVLRVTPAAAFAIQQSVPTYSQVRASYTPPIYFPLSPWAGFGVLCGYTALALGLAFVVLRRRDA
jgi:ABC-type transport system involved in multi-copper enzyme maturation permease subunit